MSLEGNEIGADDFTHSSEVTVSASQEPVMAPDEAVSMVAVIRAVTEPALQQGRLTRSEVLPHGMTWEELEKSLVVGLRNQLQNLPITKALELVCQAFLRLAETKRSGEAIRTVESADTKAEEVQPRVRSQIKGVRWDIVALVSAIWPSRAPAA